MIKITNRSVNTSEKNIIQNILVKDINFKLTVSHIFRFIFLICIIIICINDIFYENHKKSMITICFIVLLIISETLKEKYEKKSLYKETKFLEKAVIYHDLKNLLFAVHGYITIGKYEKAKEKIITYCGLIPDDKIHSNNLDNSYINYLVKSKTAAIKQNNIDFNFINNLNFETAIDPSDLCIIIGNALDNAIEANEKINERDKRWIKLEIFNDNVKIIISISNAVNKTVDLKFKTSKKDKSYHGFGINNIKMAVEKNQGLIFVSQKKHVFNLKIEIPSVFFNN